MKVQALINSHVVDDERFDRFNNFDPKRFDYTAEVLTPDGKELTYRNPNATGGSEPTARNHWFPDGSKLLAFGTAFWEWPAKLQHTVGIDIDTDHGHADGLTSEAFQAALEAACRVPWLEVRRSSGGKGLHVFPKFTRPVEVATRKESSALAMAVVELASQIADFDLKASKDCAGSNFWIYKADAPENAYEVIKPATEELDPDELPADWREAAKTSSKKSEVHYAPSTVELSPEHKAIEEQIESMGFTINYVEDVGCWHIHTCALQKAFEKFGYRGFFATSSAGTDPGEPNGYMFPLPDGGFFVKRFGNAKEHASWIDGPSGQYAYLNVDLPFQKALNYFCNNKSTTEFFFTRSSLLQMLKVVGLGVEIPELFEGRTITLKASKSIFQLTVDKLDSDPSIDFWMVKNKVWQRSFDVPVQSEAQLHADAIRTSDVVRAVSTDTESAKWCIHVGGDWVGTTMSEVNNVLLSLGIFYPKIIMGYIRRRPFKLVFEPFKPEYLPGRKWNRHAPQLACEPAKVAGPTPTWDAVFNHLGSGLDDDIALDKDCQSRGITSGSQYLRLWSKLLIEKPEQRSPYLFLTSRENNTGKTTLGVAMSHLIEPGVAEINEESLVDKFTGELEGKVLCLIEELDLRDKQNKAYTTLKRVLTSKTLTIRKMRMDAYTVPNFTHFIHTANDANFVPCETEDMRIVLISVPPLTELIEGDVMEERLKQEAPSMLRKLFDMPLPERCGRFWLPVVQSALKEAVLAGLYDEQRSDAEEGLLQFASTCLIKNNDASAPTKKVLERYDRYCKENGYRQVAKMAFLKTLREKAGFNSERKQVRIGDKRPWHYMGMALAG